MRRHDLDQRTEHGAAVNAEIEREHQFDRQHLAERRRGREPEQRRIGRHERQARDRQQHRLAADPVGHRAADRIPDEVGHGDHQGDQQGVLGGEFQHGLAEGRRIDGDEVEGHGGHRRQHHAEQDDPPVHRRRSKHLRRGRMFLHGQERRGFFQRPAQKENKGNDQAADEERNAPAPCRDGSRRHHLAQHEADDRSDENRDLLAGGLERGVEAPVAGRGNLGEIDRHAAKFDAGGKALQQPADQHDDRRGDADAGIGRADRDRHRA